MKEQSPWWWWNKDSRRRSGGAKSAESRHLIQSILRGDITNSNEISHLCRRSLMQALGALLLRHILCALPIIIFFKPSHLHYYAIPAAHLFNMRYNTRCDEQATLNFVILLNLSLAFSQDLRLTSSWTSPVSRLRVRVSFTFLLLLNGEIRHVVISKMTFWKVKVSQVTRNEIFREMKDNTTLVDVNIRWGQKSWWQSAR